MIGGLKQAFENPLVPKFSVQNAIIKEVEREDMARWGQSRDLPFTPVPELRVTGKQEKLALWRFIHSFEI